MRKNTETRGASARKEPSYALHRRKTLGFAFSMAGRHSSNTICCAIFARLHRLVDDEQTEGLLVFPSFGIGDPGAPLEPLEGLPNLRILSQIFGDSIKMEKNVFLRLAEERYTTKHYNGKMIPREQFATLCEILRLAPRR